MNRVLETWKREIDVQSPKNAELLVSHLDSMAFLFGNGLTYYFIMNFWKFELEYASKNIVDHIDVPSNEFKINDLLTVLHPADQKSLSKKEEVVLKFFGTLSTDEYFDYKPSYFLRVRAKDGTYRTILHQASVLSTSNDGKIEQVLSVHTDVTHLDMPLSNDVVILKRNSQDVVRYSTGNAGDYELNTTIDLIRFTRRELEILKLLSKGENWKEIAGKLNISPHTIHTHKRNMMSKTGCKNSAHLISEAILSGVI